MLSTLNLTICDLHSFSLYTPICCERAIVFFCLCLEIYIFIGLYLAFVYKLIIYRNFYVQWHLDDVKTRNEEASEQGLNGPLSKNRLT